MEEQARYEATQRAIADCDRRLDKNNQLLSTVTLQKQVWLLSTHQINRIIDPDTATLDNQYNTRQRYLEKGIKCIELEKEMYRAMLKKNYKLLPHFLNKYNDHTTTNIELTETLVKLQYWNEQEYIVFCNEAKEQYEYLKKLSDAYNKK